MGWNESKWGTFGKSMGSRPPNFFLRFKAFSKILEQNLIGVSILDHFERFSENIEISL